MISTSDVLQNSLLTLSHASSDAFSSSSTAIASTGSSVDLVRLGPATGASTNVMWGTPAAFRGCATSTTGLVMVFDTGAAFFAAVALRARFFAGPDMVDGG